MAIDFSKVNFHYNNENNDAQDDLNTNYLETGLCVPHDRLEDLTFSTNFINNDLIRLDDVNVDNNEFIQKLHSNFGPAQKKKKLGKGRRGTKKLRKDSRRIMFQKKEGIKCSHCEAEDTPQWRIGPLGRNTLCNACGLRYKVGKLVDNYRPAASPSFDSAKHSNFYRRLMRDGDCICDEKNIGEDQSGKIKD